MELTELERDFLERLSDGPWLSPPMFDHEIVARIVELGLVETETFPSGEIEYHITDSGRAALGPG
jgi:DNA-binding PadR family transcriptional regulator